MRDLLAKLEAERPSLPFPGHGMQAFFQFGGAGMGDLYPSIQNGIGVDYQRPPAAEILISVLFDAVRGPWPDDGGVTGDAVIANGFLAVEQTQSVQREVAQFLKILGGPRPADLDMPSLPVRRPNYPFADDAAIYAALDRRQSVEYVNVPLRDVLDDLNQRVGLRGYFDEQSIIEEGLTIDEPINLVASDLTVRSLLRLVLERFQLTVYVEEGFLRVTTQIAAEDELITVAYPIPQRLDDGDTRSSLELLRSSLSGGRGGIRALSSLKLILVRDTHRVHEKIAGILASLVQQAAARNPAEPTTEVRLYRVTDPNSLTDLMENLPLVVATDRWNDETTIVKVGQVLAIRQTARCTRKSSGF